MAREELPSDSDYPAARPISWLPNFLKRCHEIQNLRRRWAAAIRGGAYWIGVSSLSLAI